VDGAGSGLDADLLDGLSAGAFVQDADSAGGDVSGLFAALQIQPDAVGADEVTNPTRGVNLPLPAFIDKATNQPVEGDAADDAAPDFFQVTGHLLIDFDDDLDGADPDVADTNSIATTFTVPPDFDSGGIVALRARKDAQTAPAIERFNCNIVKNDEAGSAAGTVNVTQAASAVYTVNLGAAALAPGDSVTLTCSVNSPPNAPDDRVRLESVEWRYTATQ
jgi:hypothetical protein